ncbi:MAG: endonuclease/exonuclease/phosphatase family protein [Cyanobacteria bacterium P01_F01_bin.3]
MPITITTWNVQNFSKGSKAFEEKLDFLANTLEALGSDVVALQEILDPEALQAIADRLSFHAFAASPDGRGNRVAFLTREPPVEPPQDIIEWQLPPGEVVRRFSRDGEAAIEPNLPRPAQQITVSHGDKKITLLNVHMKSKLLTFGRSRFSTSDETLRVQTAYFGLKRRAAESTTLREISTQLLAAEKNTILLGDFNDGPQAATTEALYGPPGSQPRGPDDSTRAFGAFQRKDKGDTQRLFNITNLVPAEIRWTREHKGKKEMLDYILVSEGLMPRDRDGLRQVPKMSILNEDVPNLVSSNPNVGGIVPDHAPVTATFV